MGLCRIVVALGPQKHMEDEPQRIGNRQQRPQGGQHRHRPIRTVPDRVGSRIQHHLFRQEPVEQRDTRHGQRADCADDEGDRHKVTKAAQTFDIAGMGLMVDDARRHEECCLEGQVIDDVKDRDNGRKGCPETQKHGQQAKVADRRKGQERLQIVFEERDQRPDNHRDQAGRGDDIEPRIGSRERGPHPRHQEHTGFDHRRRMQVGRHRRGCGHGVRQPEMKRKLGRLGERTKQDQDERWQIPLRRLDLLSCGEDVGQIVTAHDIAQDQHPTNHGQTTGPRHSKGHSCALPPFGQMLPVSDQEERRQGCQLPEDQQQQDVIRQHDAKHRALKQKQIGKELPHRILRRQIEPGVKRDQQTDAKDHSREQKPQTVQKEASRKTQLRKPFNLGNQDFATKYGWRKGSKHHQRQQGRDGREGCASVTARPDHDTRHQRAEEWQDRDYRKQVALHVVAAPQDMNWNEVLLDPPPCPDAYASQARWEQPEDTAKSGRMPPDGTVNNQSGQAHRPGKF